MQLSAPIGGQPRDLHTKLRPLAPWPKTTNERRLTRLARSMGLG